MAQWKETLEPYVKVIESVKTAVLNPSAGGDLILGAVLISDSGPSEPTLITSQSDFLKVFAAEELTKDYVKSLDSLYVSDPGSSLASTMWLNAYRLAGSASLLICRASKASNIIYSQPLKEDYQDYVLKDSEILKSVPSFRLVITPMPDGWAIAVNGVGVIGNLVDNSGARYDYKVDTLPELVEKLNETDKFYTPSYEFCNWDEDEDKWVTWSESDSEPPMAVLFNEVYLAQSFLDQSMFDKDTESWGTPTAGLAWLVAAEPESAWAKTDAMDDPQSLIDLNSSSYSGFKPFTYYASNLYNTRSELSVRIRRFNHNAVTSKKTTSPDESPWTVDTKVLSAGCNSDYDFYEFCVMDPSISSEPQLFNVGNLPGRGDIKTTDLTASLGMIYINLPEDLSELGLNYFGFSEDDNGWVAINVVEGEAVDANRTSFKDKDGNEYSLVATEDKLVAANIGDLCVVGPTASEKYYLYEYKFPEAELKVDLKIDDKSSLLKVSDGDIKLAWDKIEDDERYVVEGFADLGCTYPGIQNYVANIAVNSNYFYAFSLANTTNYMTIANSASKMAVKSHKLYAAAPWDYDDGTVGFQFAVSPSTIYWETVLRNRLNNNEFAGVFGQNAGRVSVMNLAKEFKKSERQLLLTKKINTIGYDNYLGIHHFNDNYTFTEESFVMSEECNSRLQIRISKAMPLLLNQFKGRQNTAKTWKEIVEVVNYWFNNIIMRYNYTIAEYRVICNESNNTAESIRANKVFVKVQVRFNSSIKYITVYNDAYPIGVDFEE